MCYLLQRDCSWDEKSGCEAGPCRVPVDKWRRKLVWGGVEFAAVSSPVLQRLFSCRGSSNFNIRSTMPRQDVRVEMVQEQLYADPRICALQTSLERISPGPPLMPTTAQRKDL